jgi:hypothetical protein
MVSDLTAIMTIEWGLPAAAPWTTALQSDIQQAWRIDYGDVHRLQLRVFSSCVHSIACMKYRSNLFCFRCFAPNCARSEMRRLRFSQPELACVGLVNITLAELRRRPCRQSLQVEFEIRGQASVHGIQI